MEIFILVIGKGRKMEENTTHTLSSVVLTSVVKKPLPDKGSLLAIISILVILLLHNDIIKVRTSATVTSVYLYFRCASNDIESDVLFEIQVQEK